MANPDMLNPGVRAKIIQEIKAEENKQRRAESLRRFEVYKQRQEKFIVDKLEDEFSTKTVREMRKILSINLCPRIINQLASIYNTAPSREFGSGELTEDQDAQIEALYHSAKVDVKMMQANRYLKLNDQVILQVVPRNMEICVRVILPHHVDVIPDEMDPERPFCYIVSVFDKYQFVNQSTDSQSLASGGSNSGPRQFMDGVNQSIADSEDYKAELERYEVWTNEYNFIMNGKGDIVSGDEVDNPIQEMPFVDVSCEKDFEFWIRTGNGIVDFAIDFGAQLSDIANIIRLQGYAQAIVSAISQPQNMTVGPNHILFLPLDPGRPELKPTFEFVNPGSDLQSGLDFLEMTLRLFLTSKGIDPKTISGKLDAQGFASGVERLLSMVEKFEASKQDVELMRHAEDEVFELLVKWSNAYQGTDKLNKELQIATLPDDIAFSVNYAQPEAVQTKTEEEDSIIKLLQSGLITKQRAIMDIYNMDEAQADEMLQQIESEKAIVMPVVQPQPGQQPQDMVNGKAQVQ